MSAFAAPWWIGGLLASGGAAPVFYVLPFVISAAIIIIAARRPLDAASRDDGKRIGRVVGIASSIEGLLIFLAFVVLGNLNASDLALPVVAIIVGVHFIPLARLLPAPRYYVTGAALVALGLIAFFLPVEPRDRAVGIGAACILWLTAWNF